MGITMAPTIRSAIAKLKMNMLLTWQREKEEVISLDFRFEFFKFSELREFHKFCQQKMILK